MMTILGMFGAFVGFIAPNLPENTPVWLRLVMGGILAALSAGTGKTHPGFTWKNGKGMTNGN